MVLGIDCGLHIVADDSGVLAAGCHRTRIRVSQRDLLVFALHHLGFDRTEPRDLFPQFHDFVPEPHNLGHTFGAVIATPEFGPASDSVVSMMKSVHIVAQGSDATWYGFYRGFGWFVSVFFIFSIVVTWYLGGKSAGDRVALTPVTWSLFAGHAAGSVIAWIYFFFAPILFSTAIAMLLGIGCVRDSLTSRRASADDALRRHQGS